MSKFIRLKEMQSDKSLLVNLDEIKFIEKEESSLGSIIFFGPKNYIQVTATIESLEALCSQL